MSIKVVPKVGHIHRFIKSYEGSSRERRINMSFGEEKGTVGVQANGRQARGSPYSWESAMIDKWEWVYK